MKLFEFSRNAFLIITIFLLGFSQKTNSQWKYTHANNLKGEVIINYEIIYDKEPTKADKKSPTFSNNIVIIFNKSKMKIQKFYQDAKINYYSILDYNKTKSYSCRIYNSSSYKLAVVNDFRNPKKTVAIKPNETKTILGFECDKATTQIKGKTVDLYYTKKFGLRYCSKFNVNGFLLEYPGYDKKLGHYRVVAKTIHYKQLGPDIFSLDGFKIHTQKEYDALVAKSKASSSQSAERYAKARIDNVGKNSKTFSIRSIDGKKLVSKDMKGEVTVLNFWFTTCPPCKKEIPSLNKLKEKYKGENVNFIAVATDPEYKLDAFLKKTEFNFDVVPEGRWLADKYNVSAYPTNIVIDKSGVIQLFEIGYKSDIIERISYQIDKALKN